MPRDHDEYEPVTNIDLICPQGLTSHLDDTMGREQFMVATSKGDCLLYLDLNSRTVYIRHVE